MFVMLLISIHAPREGSDLPTLRRTSSGCYFNPRSPRGERHIHCVRLRRSRSFQSTLPARGATYRLYRAAVPHAISIHAPREGSDLLFFRQPFRLPNFNPRSPRGERLSAADDRMLYLLFQSTLPARGATVSRTRGRPPDRISIHAPREGSDLSGLSSDIYHVAISIHAPREGSD